MGFWAILSFLLRKKGVLYSEGEREDDKRLEPTE